MADAPVKLSLMTGNYPNTQPLKSGKVTSSLVNLDFVDVKVANQHFKAVVREAKYDVSELAIVTFLQAKTYGKPYVLMPAVAVSRGQLQTIAYDGERGTMTPKDIAGKKVGVRAYTQTTGAWVRGILQEDYGVDVNGITWITTEDPHLAEYQDPPGMVVRVADDKSIPKMVLEGETDRRHRWRHDPRSAPQISRRRSRSRQQALCRQEWRRADQSHVCRAAIALERAAGCGARSLPHAGRKRQARRAAGDRDGGGHPLRRRGVPHLARAHHRLFVQAEADPASLSPSTSCSTTRPAR